MIDWGVSGRRVKRWIDSQACSVAASADWLAAVTHEAATVVHTVTSHLARDKSAAIRHQNWYTDFYQNLT